MSVGSSTATATVNQAQYYFIPGTDEIYFVDVANGWAFSRWVRCGRGYRIGEIDECHALKPGRSNSNGKIRYYYVHIRVNGHYENVYLHQLICEIAHGPAPGPGMQACHNDGNPAHNWWWNLRWDTPKGNSADRNLHGTDMKGEENPQAKLTWNLVQEMREKYETGDCNEYDLALEYGIAQSKVNKVLNNKSWVDSTYQRTVKSKHVKGEKSHLAKLTREKVAAMRADWATGIYTQEQLGRKYGVSQHTVWMIVNNKTWFDPDYEVVLLRH